MNALTHCKTSLAIATLFAASGAFAGTMSHADYSAHKSQIEADFKTDKVACDKFTGNEKDVCIERAKGKESVAKAELEYNNSGKSKDAYKVSMAKSDADYAVAKEMCDDKKGSDKDACVKEAQAAHARAIADAKKS